MIRWKKKLEIVLRNGAIIRYGDFQRNEEIIRWIKMKMFELIEDRIIRQKDGDVSEKLRNDQMENKDEMVSDKWSDNKI
jgi:hypothetical protein